MIADALIAPIAVVAVLVGLPLIAVALLSR